MNVETRTIEARLILGVVAARALAVLERELALPVALADDEQDLALQLGGVPRAEDIGPDLLA